MEWLNQEGIGDKKNCHLRSEFGSGHRISLKSVDDLVSGKDADRDSICSIERKHSFRSIKSSGKESDCDSITRDRFYKAPFRA
jgi:hypothetical protein